MRKNQITTIVLTSLLAAGALVGTAMGKNSVVSFGDGAHQASHHVIEKTYFAPGKYQASTDATVTSICHNQPESYSYGEKAHWYCLECNQHFADQACTDVLDASEFQFEAFESSRAYDAAEGDLINSARSDKQKNVDQGTTTTYVKDNDKVATLISRSYVSNQTADTTGSEIRFVFDGTNTSHVTQVTFDYRYYDVGSDVDTSSGSHFFFQLNNQSTIYHGYDLDAVVTADDAWHSASVDVSETDVGALTFKIIGLRGHLLLSNVKVSTDLDVLFDAAKKAYMENIYYNFTSNRDFDNNYGTVRTFNVPTGGPNNVCIGPGNFSGYKFDVDANKYKNLVLWVNVPATVTKYNITAIGWDSAVKVAGTGATADRETIATNATTNGWIKVELNASYYPHGLKTLMFAVTGGAVDGTWKCTSIYGSKVGSKIILNGAAMTTGTNATDVGTTFDAVRGGLHTLKPTGHCQFGASIDTSVLANYTSLTFNIFIPEEYNNAGSVWYLSTIKGTATQVSPIQYRVSNNTMETGWISFTITNTSHAAVWTNGIQVLQVNRVESTNANLIIGSIYGL